MPAKPHEIRSIGSHLRCIAAVVLSYALSSRTALAIFGFVFRRVLRLPLASIFLLYPAREEYADAIAYRWHQRRFSWHPGLIGFYRQGGRYGLIFGIPNPEVEIRDERNTDNLRDLMDRMAVAQASVGATRKVFAGILPSMFSRIGIEDEHLAEQRFLTARAVLEALDEVLALHALPRDTPVLVLGGRGYIATEVARLGTHLNAVAIDLTNPEGFRAFVSSFEGKPAVVLNLSKSGALLGYAHDLWPGTIVLNEVYPEPSREELDVLRSRGVVCSHIVGVTGRAWPAFPRAYRGGVPCCASLPISPLERLPILVTRL